MEPKRLSLDDIFDLSMRALRAAGASEVHARAVAEVVAAAEADECGSHGVYRLLGYVGALRDGTVDGASTPVLAEPSAALVKVDARSGFAPLAVKLGRPRLVEKAKEIGVAALAIARCYHFSALWIDVEPLARAALVAFACTIGQRRVAPHGAKRPLLGTNPIAFGWPREGALPFVFDFATSAVARGEIELRARRGESIPVGWALGLDGTPTTDPVEALAGALLPFGGHKGAALSIMVELLAGALLGELTALDAAPESPGGRGPRLGGELIVALDPRFFGDGAYAGLAESLFADLMQEGDGRIPSSRRYDARARTRTEGVIVAGPLYEEISALAR